MFAKPFFKVSLAHEGNVDIPVCCNRVLEIAHFLSIVFHTARSWYLFFPWACFRTVLRLQVRLGYIVESGQWWLCRRMRAKRCCTRSRWQSCRCSSHCSDHSEQTLLKSCAHGWHNIVSLTPGTSSSHSGCFPSTQKYACEVAASTVAR